MMKSEGYHLDILYKKYIEKLGVINAAPTFNTHLHRLQCRCHQPKMNFAGGSKVLSSYPLSPNGGRGVG
jgi:hypothetical protein